VLTATADAVSRLVPEDVRGEAMGWHGSSLTIGLAVGAPLAGAAIDGVAPWAGFAAVGLVGLLIGAFGVVAQARLPGRRSRPGAEAMPPVRDPAATLVD
jgi:predicted MFS family arabinose efflux permease